MKTQLAAIELVRIVKELKEKLINGKINQIYVDFDRAEGTKKELLFEIYANGKHLLRVILPSFIYITTIKQETPQRPDGYCLYLRKYLKNARIKDIEQIGAERILKFTIEARDITKQEFVPLTYFIYIELFSKGNMILTNEQNIILSPLEVQEWSGRSVRPKERYSYPCSKYNLFKMNEKDLETALESSEKEAIVTILALDFGLGGQYAEELCFRADIQKKEKPAKIEARQLYDTIQLMVKDILIGTPYVVKENNTVIDVLPCLLHEHKERVEPCETFMYGLNILLLPTGNTKTNTLIKTKKETAEEKIRTMMKNQEKQILHFQEEVGKNQVIGEKIYEKYVLLEEIFKQLKEARKTKSWQEIKKAIKEHTVIKQINEKNQEIIVEL